MSDYGKSTSVIINELYPFIAKALDKNVSKLKNVVFDFINKNSEQIYDVAPYDVIYFRQEDINAIFKALNISEKDIDNIFTTRLGSGTNFDVAVREFSNNQSINKIIFTDGWPGKMPAEDTKRINVIWLVYENKNFAPCCGKVINVQPKKNN